MRTLYLIRHAKSSWDDATQSDFDRPLNKRGEHDAPIMAGVLRTLEFSSAQLISSPANRAYSTALIFCKKLQLPLDKIVTDERIYEAGLRELMTVIRETDNETKTVLLFGHNPGLTSLTNLLGDKFIPEMPTCSIVGLEFEIGSWRELERQSGKIFLFDYPKNHSK